MSIPAAEALICSTVASDGKTTSGICIVAESGSCFCVQYTEHVHSLECVTHQGSDPGEDPGFLGPSCAHGATEVQLLLPCKC